MPLSIFSLAFLEKLIIEFHEGFFQVGLKSARGLQGKFAAVLQDGYWEVVCRHGSEEESEVGALVVIFIETQDNFLQTRHPTFGQVAVGKQHPVSIYFGPVDEFFCLFALALTQGDH